MPNSYTTITAFRNDLDTSALVAVLFGESEADLYTQLIYDADMFFQRAGIIVEAFTVEQVHIARQAFHDFGKGRHPARLNFGDCFAYALSRITGEPLLFKGDDFKKTDIVSAV
jgi:ribonuclease VapC